MKFFTRGYLSGEFERVHQAYEEHLQRLLTRFPSELTALSALPLHDGLIERAIVDHESRVVTLVLIGGDLQSGYERLTLEYTAAEVLPESLPELRAASNDSGAELIYDELHEAPGLKFEHRITFSPYREVAICFEKVGITRSGLSKRVVSHQRAERCIELGVA